MKALPNEILLNIFEHLPLRYVVTIFSIVCKNWNLLINQSIIYHTLHIHSKQHLRKWIQIAKERKINNSEKLIGYYVKRIILHYNYLPNDIDIDDFLAFPNLQYAGGLETDYKTINENKSVYLQLHQPTDFLYRTQDEKWTAKFNQIKENLKSLSVYMLNEVDKSIPQQLEIIYMILIKNHSSQRHIPIKMLVLPTLSLTNLIKLKINFSCKYSTWRDHPPDFIINQQTFENIHRSCPSLESLSLEHFFMHISVEDYNDDNKNKIIPAHQLKKMNIIGRICSPECCYYLATKYPHLESLSLYTCFHPIINEEEGWENQFEKAIINMLLQLASLKKLSCQNNQFSLVWPYYEFFKWMNLSTNCITHLEYSHSLTSTASKKLSNINDKDIHNRNIIILPIQPQFNYLNRLTYLLMDLENLYHLSYTFLINNVNTTVVSTILQELKIENIHTSRLSCMYIYDWLDMYPNLSLFKIDDGAFILDSSDAFDNCIKYKGIKSESFYQVHQLIKKRNLQQNQHQIDILSNHHHHPIYKLKSLEISSSLGPNNCPFHRLFFKNGFDDLLKKCNQLKRLELNNITFYSSKDQPIRLQFDIPHLHLEVLKIDNIQFLHINSKLPYSLYNFVNTINIYEILTDQKQTIEILNPSNDKAPYTLNINCKFIDAVIQSNEVNNYNPFIHSSSLL